MAQVDHIKISGTTYDVGSSPNATIAFTSSDVADGSATAWTTVNKLSTGETWNSILAKISQMFKNIRFLKKTIDNMPTPTTVNNATLSLQVNGTTKTTFYANDATNRTFNISNGTSTTGNGTISVGGTAVSVYGLKTVATTGSYNDLTDKPTIPTVNNATLSLQANGTTKTTFYANDSTNRTFNISSGTTNGAISVGGTAVSVYGLGSAAYKTASTTQTNSSSYVPTSSLVYSMNQKLESLITYGTTDIGAGATLSTGTIYCVYE